MPFEMTTTQPRRIAVLGAGISGLGAAHLLAQGHSVVLFEAEDRLGGHARTKLAGPNRDQPVDTGFIVFNYANYPNLAALFKQLDVPVVKSNMSFGASIDGGRIEYALTSLDSLFAQKKHLFSPTYLRMVRDILHFNKNALAASKEPGLTIGGLLAKLGTGDAFRDHYLLPFSGAIWSTPVEKILDFPADAMMSFFDNHALLQASGQHQWYTVQGGSQAYVSRLEADLRRKGVDIRTKSAVSAVRRTPLGVQVKVWGADWELFDEVVFATHSDQALSMLDDPTPQEISGLGAIRYQKNQAILHSDESLMPKRRKVWASWIYAEAKGGAQLDRIDLSYWMNSLQPWLTGDNLFVTLNSKRPVREDLIWDEVSFAHPVYDQGALDGQKAIQAINGSNRTWFCGAWMRNGFHEDGLASAVDVARALNAVERLDVAAE